MLIQRCLLAVGTSVYIAAAIAADPVSTSSANASDHFVRMKSMQLVDNSMNKMPAVDVLIPTNWQFQGDIRVANGMGGCFADFEGIFIHTQNPDGSIVMESIPNFTWQYADDQGTVRTMTQEGQSFARAGIKPCPVMPPMHASEFLQKIILPKYRADRQVVSIDPYPAFNQLLRQRLGLPVNDTSNQGAVRTEAARAHLDYERAGKAVEEWITVAQWTRTFPSGHGNVYDCHATMLMSFRTPKGQLESHENLFKLIAFNIRHEKEWDAKLNGMIATLYQQQQIEEAKRSQIIAQFQMHVAQTINETTANMMRGANQAAFGQDQLIRGVQTFRNPDTGATFELSNLHDHAWLNGGNEYLMSDDPNFNPNGKLDGSWTSLQPVRAQP
jgi:hypothetical protein